MSTSVPPSPPASPLAIADYRRFWSARCAAVFATSGMVVVLGYQLYDPARGSCGMSIRTAAFQLGLFGLAQFLPQILFAPVAGAVVFGGVGAVLITLARNFAFSQLRRTRSFATHYAHG